MIKLELKIFLPNINQTQAATSVHCRHPALQCIVNGDDSAVFRFLSLATLTFDLRPWHLNSSEQWIKHVFAVNSA